MGQRDTWTFGEPMRRQIFTKFCRRTCDFNQKKVKDRLEQNCNSRQRNFISQFYVRDTKFVLNSVLAADPRPSCAALSLQVPT